MPSMYGNVNRPNGVGSNYSTPDFAKNKYILKEDLRRGWYIYRPSESTSLRIYPVFDESGNPCPPRTQDDSTSFSILPEAFAVLRVAQFAGLDKNLEFVDYCIDGNNYAAPGQEYVRTPYEWLISGLRKMLPKKDGTPGIGADGFPTPQRLRLIQQSVGYSSDSIMFRCAMMSNKGQAMSTKNSVEGILFNAVFLMSQKSCIESFVRLMNQPKDVRNPVSSDNCTMDSMFAMDGVSLQIQKSDRNYFCSNGYNPNFARVAGQVFQVTDQNAYYAKIRENFGQYQRVGDMLNLLTVEQMINILKGCYPISWLWFGLKDSPYNAFITPSERQQAMSDPEMAERFGVEPSVNIQTPQQTPPAPAQPQPTWMPPNNYQSTQVSQPAVNTAPQGYPPPPVYPAQQEGGLQRPVAPQPFPGNTTISNGGPQGNNPVTGQMPGGVQAQGGQASELNKQMNDLFSKYGGSEFQVSAKDSLQY